jgi:hypothetical protein
MPTWVLRKSVDGERVGAPVPCASPHSIGRALGMLTVEEQVAAMLDEYERAEEASDGLKIYKGQELVGYIVVLSTEDAVAR